MSVFLRPLSDARAKQYVEWWRKHLGIALLVRTERATIWQVTNEKGRPGCGLVGVHWDEQEAKIVHTRRLTQEDIVHELLHVAHPAWSEAKVVEETNRLLVPRRADGESAPYLSVSAC